MFYSVSYADTTPGSATQPHTGEAFIIKRLVGIQNKKFLFCGEAYIKKAPLCKGSWLRVCED